ncbi:tRNA glutamyl-Q(34) synthetase GluQRS [Boudabousia liubingyangii]|uniref:tRNA glutamyl-Q(34) synthetase GluQRS n=1 Tax=Boudabousia liubingyangii TaxID=1921764 RepID=A0A1Q5PLS2_9ACTO|nr:tRNA glutamyl-Q(34) synthetase GluQRS [Boudabousia liubingyangii]OKL48015.1 tRNA glutamyl-Q(34) synthetase GluQRS [Boudabousia liubingyangii]
MPSSFRGGAGRFAPSPTGDLHLGNLRTAILAHAWAKATGRRCLLRVEDIDRVRSGSTERQLEQLQQLGLRYDAAPLIQTTRTEAHHRAIETLRSRGFLFECYCSRKDIQEAASAPHTPPGHYPGTCLHLSEEELAQKRELFAQQGRQPALRLNVPEKEWTIFDELHGDYTGPVDNVVIRRNDGAVAYNLAVVVDDAYQGIDQVTRGDDLLSQAPTQAAIAHALGLAEPVYVHVPLALNQEGQRLSKRDGAVTLPDLQEQGIEVPQVVNLIARSLDLGPQVDACQSVTDLLQVLDESTLRRMPLHPWVWDGQI